MGPVTSIADANMVDLGNKIQFTSGSEWHFQSQFFQLWSSSTRRSNEDQHDQVKADLENRIDLMLLDLSWRPLGFRGRRRRTSTQQVTAKLQRTTVTEQGKGTHIQDRFEKDNWYRQDMLSSGETRVVNFALTRWLF